MHGDHVDEREDGEDGILLWDTVAIWGTMLEQESLATTTISHYVMAARRFAVWMTARRRSVTLASIDNEDARVYCRELVAHGYTPSTINSALTALRHLFTASGHRADNPFEHVSLLSQS